MVSGMMAEGFVHGVLNSDNLLISVTLALLLFSPNRRDSLFCRATQMTRSSQTHLAYAAVVQGEVLDYGPFSFLSTYEPGHVSASFDAAGLYAFGRQVEACRWNLHRLGKAFSLLPCVFRTVAATARSTRPENGDHLDQTIPSLEDVLVSS
jgi:uncharacterized protein YdiU (UPF0061 family)